MDFRRANRKDVESLTDMGMFLWANERREQIAKGMRSSLSSADHAVFVCAGDGVYAGFTDISLRRDYVPGVTAFPVGYVEGIYVKPSHRRQGVARRLVQLGEAWAVEKGCRQMASDTWLWNTLSQEFHTRTGFHETERVVFYVKRIDRSEQQP
jgi:aminoglycoside 6'-N-acetyltransferase I